VNSVHLIVYSDYLCPWCYNASVRMTRLREELGESVRIEWRSFLLRPEPNPSRDLETFRRYTRSWERPGAETDSGTFRAWEGDAGPPSHSIPPHRVAKAAATLGEAAFERIHGRLLHAYFAENRDITAIETLREIWKEAELPPEEFTRSEDRALVEAILREHKEALAAGASGVPSVRRADQDVAVTGAFPVEFYRRWVLRALEEEATG
jgi:predicted DsbA family dithiol-disulfide isomerase